MILKYTFPAMREQFVVDQYAHQDQLGKQHQQQLCEQVGEFQRHPGLKGS